jgi:hypothetical protein
MKTIPQEGIRGAEALREAAAGEFGQICELVGGAVKSLINQGLTPSSMGWKYVPIEAMFADRVVVRQEGRYYAYPYTISEANQVQLGAPLEVVEDYKPVTAVREAMLIEAAGEGSGKFLVRVIAAGLSGNGNYYPDAALKEAVPLFNGVRVFVKSDEEHIKGGGKDFSKLLGRLVEAKFIAGAAVDTGRIEAVLELIDPNDAVGTKLKEAVSRGMADLFGLSIDALAKTEKALREGKKVRVAKQFTKVKSVDLIVEPGAGGGLVRVVEAADDQSTQEEQAKMKTRLFEALQKKHPKKVEGKTIDDFTEDQLVEALAEDSVREAAPTAAATVAGAGNFVTREELVLREARAVARELVLDSGLPKAARERVLSYLGTAAASAVTEQAVREAIDAEKKYIGMFTEAGRVSMGGMDIAVTEDRSVKVATMLDAFFDPAHKDHRQVRSFKECYAEITGDRRVTGRLEDMNRSRLAEALGDAYRESLDSTSFANVLGNSITRRMLAEYQNANQYDAWRRIANVVPVNDFRTNERTRMGGYGDLDSVGEGDPYPPMTSPTDEKATYAVGKKGGTEDITLEMIKNDDVGSIQRIPVKIARSAKRTLAKFAFDFIRTNPLVYDGVALFHASHGNLGAAALDATSLAARRLAMLKQTELSSADRLGIGPKGILVPVDLQEAAVNLFNRNTNNDKTFVQMMTLEIIPVWYWTDTNDWALYADPMDIPGLEIGFLDGQEEPQLFVQDMPTVGSMFTNDKVTYKIRHIYGGNITDFRAFDKSVV